MARTKISEFSSTPANNTDIDGINLAEGCAPSGINDAIRELMSQLKDWQSGTSNDPYVVGSSGSLTLSGGTANGVAYLNGSKVVTSGTALSFDGSNLGLGVTPSAWNADYKNFAIGTGGELYGRVSTTETGIGSNYYRNSGGSYIYLTSAAASYQAQVGGVHYWFTAASGTAGNAITFTQAMTLDASGNLGIGTTSPAARLNVASTGESFTISGGGTGTQYQRFSTTGGNYYLGVSSSTGTGLLSGASAYSMCLLTESARDLCFGTNNIERARIDSSGNLLVGATSSVYSTGAKVEILYTGSAQFGSNWKTISGDGVPHNFVNSSGTRVGYIYCTATTTAYNTSSDYRLKNTIAPMTGALAKVAQLKPVTYKWNADGSDGQGFIAHELAEVVPQCVTGEKDAVDEDGNPKYQGIDTSFLVATLTAALQEAVAEINSLKARLDAANL